MKRFRLFNKYYFGVLFLTFLIFTNGVAAQSIIGKWNQVTARQYLNEDGAKSGGKPYVETDMSTIGAVIYEFKSDKSFVMTSTSSQGGEPRIYKGSWSLSGDALTMSPITGGQSLTSSVSFNSGDLVIETLHPESKKARKVVLIFKKL